MEEVLEYVPQMYATFAALIPAIVAILLALITKEVYSSLFIGIVIGGFFYGDIFLIVLVWKGLSHTFLRMESLVHYLIRTMWGFWCFW